MVDFILERGNYWAIIGLMMIGLYIAFAATNLIKRVVGLGLFQTSIILLYTSLGRIDGGSAPILYGDDLKSKYAAKAASEHGEAAAHGADAAADAGGHAGEALVNIYSNPLPHVLMLTAIVVGVATLAVGLAIIVRVREAYGTIESDEINQLDLEVALAEAEAALADAGSAAGSSYEGSAA